MGKGLLIAMVIATIVFGGLMLVNHSNNNSYSGLATDLTPTPTPVHLVVAAPSGALMTPEPSGNPVTEAPLKVATQAAITTSKGVITLTLFPDVAPKTVANFVKKATSGYYVNLTFHRVEDWVIQGGDPKGNGTGGGNMPTELNDKPFVIGSLGVARGGDITISNDSQFFITKKDASWLNKQYTNFGIVTSGMDVVNKMEIGDKILEITVN